MKRSPILLMALLFGLGAWLVWSPHEHSGTAPLRPGAVAEDFRLGPSRGVLEVHAPVGGPRTYRLLFRDGSATEIFDDAGFDARFGSGAREHVLPHVGNPVFRLLNITSWGGAAWVTLGFVGQAAFFLRMAIQWIASEKQRRSVVPDIFWSLSLAGGVLLFTYFVWRQDIVGVLGQSTGIVIYARNIRLIRKDRRIA